jgi:energy-coupling factor transporter ATP-binding protein EcfA2
LKNNITIENVGPIKKISLQLNKINIIMGPQSSGKSTLAKIISYCQWVEKRYVLDGEYEYKVEEQLLEFHRLSLNYFSQSSKICYDSDFVTINISLSKNKILEKIVSKNMNVQYKKTKNIYIPAERNFVSVIPNLGRYKETNDNIMSFLYDWYSTKKKYTVDNNLPILNLNVDYYHIEETDSDMLILNNSKDELSLRNGSSGLQSVIPLLMIVDYLSEKFYEETHSESNDELDSLRKQTITKQFLDEFIRVTTTSRKNKGKQNSRLTVDEFFRFIEKRSQYDHTQFIMEEPEQNLFPETQRDLVYHILKRVANSERNHSLFITTHSPYILYAINNCLMGYNVKDKMPIDEQRELKSYGSWIDPNYVDIFQLKDGQLFSIKDERTNTVTKHYFNENLNEILDEYYELLSYFSYDDK